MKPRKNAVIADELGLLQRVLPALRMIVRFPTKPNKVVSFETSVELDDIETWTTTRGRPTAVLLERLERQAAGGDSARNKPEPETPAPVAAKISPPAGAKPAHPLWETRQQFRATTFAGWLPELEAMVAGATMTAACKGNHSEPSGLRQYLGGWIGSASLWTPDNLRQFIAWGKSRTSFSSAAAAPAVTSENGRGRNMAPKTSIPLVAPVSARPSEGKSLVAASDASDSDALVALIGIRDRYCHELDRLQATLKGVNRAIVIVRAKMEAAREIIAAANGGTR